MNKKDDTFQNEKSSRYHVLFEILLQLAFPKQKVKPNLILI
ncbi:hypothetical protein [Staphylococcus schleiferi]|nr:hypothetical protein [Staphylococcus schleiferi]